MKKPGLIGFKAMDFGCYSTGSVCYGTGSVCTAACPQDKEVGPYLYHKNVFKRLM